MDAKEYDRIADLLMQIRKKYDNLILKDGFERHQRDILLLKLDHVLKMNHKFAEWDAKGWL
jgi:hypothetical protein